MTRYTRPNTGWMARAACTRRGVNPNWFHPEPRQFEYVEAAKHVCGRCPVSALCRDDQIHTNDQYGIQDGKSSRTRRRAAGRAG